MAYFRRFLAREPRNSEAISEEKRHVYRSLRLLIVGTQKGLRVCCTPSVG